MDCQLWRPPEVDVDAGRRVRLGSHRVATALETLQGWLLPSRCVLCLDPGQSPTLDLCPACEADLPSNAPACPLCASPQAAAGPGAPAEPCARCRADPPPFAAAVVPYRYAWPADALVRRLKYGRQWTHARVLGHLLAVHAAAAAAAAQRPLPQRLLPVPLHPDRERRRGANQAWEIAHAAGRRLGIAVDARALERCRDTPPQAGLDARHRLTNLAGAFRVRALRGARHVALVDDVMTTGTTLRALATELLAAGVERVEAWAVARA